MGQDRIRMVVQASQVRLAYTLSEAYDTKGGRPICYLREKEVFGSTELWSITGDCTTKPSALVINTEIEPLLALVPWELFTNYEQYLADPFIHRSVHL